MKCCSRKPEEKRWAGGMCGMGWQWRCEELTEMYLLRWEILSKEGEGLISGKSQMSEPDKGML